MMINLLGLKTAKNVTLNYLFCIYQRKIELIIILRQIILSKSNLLFLASWKGREQWKQKIENSESKRFP